MQPLTDTEKLSLAREQARKVNAATNHIMLEHKRPDSRVIPIMNLVELSRLHNHIHDNEECDHNYKEL